MPYINWVLVALSLLFSAGTALHALLYKRDPRASLGWIAVCLVLFLFLRVFSMKEKAAA